MTAAIAAPPARAGGAPLPIRPDMQARMFMNLLALRTPGGLLEVRHWAKGGAPTQRWFRLPSEAAAYAMKVRQVDDVYVGVVPRAREGGGKAALVPYSYTLWAECDTGMASRRAQELRPHLTVRSSAPSKTHCYWFLRRPLALGDLERANRRLAHHLGADMKACDAARILRVPGTYHRKTSKAIRVEMVGWSDHPENFNAGELVLDLPDPHPPKLIRPARPSLPNPDKDRLAALPAESYVPALTGRPLMRRMICCPFHKDGRERTPSFSVGGPQDTLWFCFGCDEGGDIFTLAGRLWGLDSHDQFPAILDRLKETFR